MGTPGSLPQHSWECPQLCTPGCSAGSQAELESTLQQVDFPQARAIWAAQSSAVHACKGLHSRVLMAQPAVHVCLC